MTRPQWYAVFPFLIVALATIGLSRSAAAQHFDPPVFPSVAPPLAGPATGARGAPETAAMSGAFTTITYNVGGIPQIFSGGEPSTNNPLIGPLLNRYDLALVQEDFIYHDELEAGARHAHRSPPYPVAPSFATLGDGLSLFSRFPLEGFERRSWRDCSGLLSGMFDCTARKGFSYARVELSDDVSVDVYNLHFDAGWSESDIETRTEQITQLIEAVQLRSTGRAIIIAGDTNLRHPTADIANLRRLLSELALTDACQDATCGRHYIDRIFFRSGGGVSLQALDYRIPDEFVDERGQQLSDHWPVTVTFEWAMAPPTDVASSTEP